MLDGVNPIKGLKKLFGASSEDRKATESGNLFSFGDLHLAKDGETLITSHGQVERYYSERMDLVERCHNALTGDIFTPEEKEVIAAKGKSNIFFNFLKDSERAILGNLILNKFDIKPAPFEPSDQDVSEAISALYHWTAQGTQAFIKDIPLMREAWVGGSAFQESFVQVSPGNRPVIRVVNMNPYSVMVDPNSRDMIERSDCRFMDRISWLTLADLCNAFPEASKELRAILGGRDTITNENRNRRLRDTANTRNGTFRVIERLYKVQRVFVAGVKDGNRVDIGWEPDESTVEQFQNDYPDHTLIRKTEDFFYCAIVCPAFGSKFLKNDVYYCQPKDPITDELLWPWVELFDEELDGVPSGHVQHQIAPLRVVASMAVNKLHSAVHQSAPSYTVSQNHFDEETANTIIESKATGGLAHLKKLDAPDGVGVDLIPQGNVNRDADDSMNFALSANDRVSSTPPAFRGNTEGSASGVLNQQRIQQADNQSQVLVSNYRLFLTKRCKLWYAFWREYFPHEMTVKIINKTNPADADWFTVNKQVVDENGVLKKLNDINTGRYDIVFEESWQSPTMREKTLKTLSNMMQSQGAQADPVMMSVLYMWMMRMSDAPQEFKNFMFERSQALKKQEQAGQVQGAEQLKIDGMQQVQQIEKGNLDMQKMSQDIADREAQSTTPELSMVQ